MPSRIEVPRHRSEAWLGGFMGGTPGYVSHIAAAGGTVIAAADGRIHRLRPGATRFETREPPEGQGDVLCIAVAPRLPGQHSRFAIATPPHTLHVQDGTGLAPFEFPADYGELTELMWAPRVGEGDATVCLYLQFDDDRFLMLRPDDGSQTLAFESVEWPQPDVQCITANEAGGLAFAAFDEENWDLNVGVLMDLAANEYGVRPLEAPNFYCGAQVAVAGMAAAVSFELGGVWLSRDLSKHEFVELEELGGLDRSKGGTGAGAIAFEGAGPDAALFAAVCETPDRSSIVRVDAEGRFLRIAEVTREGESPYPELPMIRALAWDATRRTLWAAAGHAGVMCTTAPGAPPPVGDAGALRAPS